MAELSVLHISQTDHLGGSGRSAYKIHAGLRALGVRSKMLVSIKDTDDADVEKISTGVVKFADKLSQKLTNALGLQYLFFPSSFFLFGRDWYRNADVIQLYNTHGGYFSHTVLPLMAQSKHIVWRLSDLWPVTGHCAFPGDCNGWRNGCKPCPHLDYFPALPVDTASFLFRLKQSLYERTQFHVVAPSSWTLKIAQESPLLKDFKIHLIPNGINAERYRPLSQEACRGELGIPSGKKALLFMAQRLPNNPRKGGDYFLEAVKRLGDRSDFLVMLVGEGAEEFGKELKCPVWRHGLLSDEDKIAKIYNAADVFVHSAPDDNLPNTVLEAMACGIPCVVFDAGGLKDAVAHKQTGFLSRNNDVASLAEGLVWSLSLAGERDAVVKQCRDAILQRFTLQTQAAAFKTLYENIVQGIN